MENIKKTYKAPQVNKIIFMDDIMETEIPWSGYTEKEGFAKKHGPIIIDDFDDFDEEENEE